MRYVEHIGQENPEKNLKPIELDAELTTDGWIVETEPTSVYKKIVYLGHCLQDGDMFACYTGELIIICKGQLNDGVY